MSDRNIAHSVRDRLKTLGKKQGRSFGDLLGQYLNESFLCRLAESEHIEKVVLKGATAYAVWNNGPHRATRDVDLLKVDAAQDATQLVAEVCRVEMESDGVVFDAEGIRVRDIRTQGVHHGVNVRVPATLGKMKETVSLDIASGDAVGNGAVEVRLPMLLPRSVDPSVRTYRPELTFSEKLHAIVELKEQNSRMKDYFDLAHMAKHQRLSGRLMAELVQGTFASRGTEMQDGMPVGLSEKFFEDPAKVEQWRGFLRKGEVTEDSALTDFRTVVLAVRELAAPVLDAAKERRALDMDWVPGEGWRAEGKEKSLGDALEAKLNAAEDRFAECLKAWHELERSNPDAVKDARLGRGHGADLFAAMRSAEVDLGNCQAAHGEQYGSTVQGWRLSWEEPAKNLGEAQGRLRLAEEASENARGARLDGVVAWDNFKRDSAPMAVLDARKSKGTSGPAIYQRYRQGFEDCRAAMSVHAQELKACVEMQQKAEKTKKYDQGRGF